jgi:transcriptional regulator with XRE-family HTH domain
VDKLTLASDSFWYRRFRQFLDLSVTEVSTATGLTANRIAQIEQGRGKPPADFENAVLRGFYCRWMRQTIPDAPAWLYDEGRELQKAEPPQNLR